MTVSFKTLDLNLLRVFDAVMEERSVLRASQKVSLSQSAVSHSLARLREMLEDELFVRTTAGMQPTARALGMAPLVREALKSLEIAVELPKFEPDKSTKLFTLAANDFTTMMIASPLLQILGREAPHVDLVIKPVTRIDLAEQIDLGRIDAAIGIFATPPERFRSSFLFEYDDVLITGAKRKLGKLDIAGFARLPIVVVSFGGEQEGAVGGFLSERGLARRSEMFDRPALEKALAESESPPRIAVSVPHFLALPALLEDTELAAIVPRPLAHSFARTHAIATHELPYPTSPIEVRVLWHERHEGDPAQEWLHEVVRRSAEDVRSGAKQSAGNAPPPGKRERQVAAKNA
ncbi:LysR family transcriptional regulator [Bradyrhizobium jicamae]|uniref:LysR family transcriptional regulator n=1 Tax=Bradyrhizobium jicamae TaxID=280332 RepID=UPI001BAE0D10|nr:LysR family transcriptional regulator [Bradyrhizobium jicamae]MBR0756496.1 LysR family transcriptional regulator [Bradyrhizobium jicamae]